MIVPGYGKKAQDWSYLTPIRALWYQRGTLGSVKDPSIIPDYSIIDTTKDSNGIIVERARQQTLVVYAIRDSGADAVPINKLVLGLWMECEWATEVPSLGSSSAVGGTTEVPDKEIFFMDGAKRRWALVEAATIANAPSTGLNRRSLAFIFPWMPAGRYKVGIIDGFTQGLDAGFVLAEQHTE